MDQLPTVAIRHRARMSGAEVAASFCPIRRFARATQLRSAHIAALKGCHRHRCVQPLVSLFDQTLA